MKTNKNTLRKRIWDRVKNEGKKEIGKKQNKK